MVVYQILLGFRKISIHLPLSVWPGSCLKCTDIYSNIVFTILRNLPPPTHPPHSVWCSGCLKWANFNLNTVFTIKHINIMFTILRNHPSPTPPHSVWPSGCLIYINTQPFSTRTFSLLFWEIFFHPPTPLCMVCLMLKTSKHDSLRPPRPLQIQVIA